MQAKLAHSGEAAGASLQSPRHPGYPPPVLRPVEITPGSPILQSAEGPPLARTLFFVALALLGAPALAEDAELAVSLGSFDIFQPDQAVEAGVQYRFRSRALRLVPHVGVHVTGDQAVFGYVGLRRPINVGRRWLLEPSFAVAAFEKGDGKDLGQVLEFRSGLDLTRRLGNGAKISLGVYHVSNASMAENNPGANSGLLTYVFPGR